MEYTFYFKDVFIYIVDLFHGAIITLQIAVYAMIFGLLLGIIGAVARNSRFYITRAISSGYVEIIRNTPLLVQILVFYFGLSGLLRLNVPGFYTAILAISIHNGGYITEIVRGGVNSIDETQVKAGLSLGMKKLTVFQRVVLPQALGNTFPALMNQFVISILASALSAIVGVQELTYRAMTVGAYTFRSIETYIVVALIYIIITRILIKITGELDKKIFKYKHI